MKAAYKVMKVFDCQWDPGMPEDVKKAFFSFYENVGNECYVSWTINGDRLYNDNDEFALNRMKVDVWLISNGAEPAKSADEEGETVLIKYWW